MIIDGRALAGIILLDLQKKISILERKPKLSVLLLGENPASLSYIKQKEHSARITGIDFELRQFNVETTEEELLAFIKKLNQDTLVDGFIVQLPLPKHIRTNKIIEAIDPRKDVDGFTSQNIGRLFIGTADLISCTPKGIMRLLHEANVKID